MLPEDIELYLFNRSVHGGGRTLLSGSFGPGTALAFACVGSFGETIEHLRVDDLTIFEDRLPAVILDVVEDAERALVRCPICSIAA